MRTLSIGIFISLLTTLLLAGCTHSGSLGQKRTNICTVRASTSLDFTDSTFTNDLVVAGDENGNALFSPKEETDSRLILTFLSPSNQKKVMGLLQDSVQLGETAAREKADVRKTLGIFREKNGTYGWPIDMVMQFHASSTGKVWNTSLEVCRTMPAVFSTSPAAKTEPCDTQATLYFNTVSVRQLASCLALISFPPHKVKATAGNARALVRFSASKSDGGSPITGYTVTSNPPDGTDVDAGSTATTHTITGLKNGAAYTFTVQAANAAGTGPASLPSNSVTPLHVPDVPLNVTATAGNARAKVSFSPPVSDGGSPITGYTVISNPPGGVDSDAGKTATTHTITGLTNGTVYTFSVQAENAFGIGRASLPSNRLTPFLVPGAPVKVKATAGNTQATVSFSPPESDGGSPITGYTVTSNPSGGTDSDAGTTATTHTITGLKNDTAYTFTVQASKAAGIGPASTPSNRVTPSDVPGAPLNVKATAGNARAKVSFSPPESDGGSPITGYTVTSNPPGGVDSDAGTTATTHTMTGLTNGATYTFTVQAANAAKTSPASAPSNRIKPADVPAVPLTVTATAGNAQAKVSFSPPESDGGSPITGYTVTSNPPDGNDANAGTKATTHTITGLKNGTLYTFTVQASNASGTGPASTPSTSVTPLHIPAAPLNVTAKAGTAGAKVSFSPPASDGGSPITGYTVISSPPGGADSDAGSTATTRTITGLKNGVAYTFTVQASNAAGAGPVSSPSNSVTPADLPRAPLTVTAAAGNARAKVSFPAPESDGGSPITGYTVISSPPGGVDDDAGTTAMTHTITGLKNGTAYTFTVRAENAAGTGSVSPSSKSVTPVDVPESPTFVTATAGNARAKVSFAAPFSDGGSPITGYTVTSIPPGGSDSDAGSTATIHTITGLANGVAYTFSVQAENAAGVGPASLPSNSVTPSDLPEAPLNVKATAGNARAKVSFSAPVSEGVSPITGYTVISSPQGGIDADAGSPATTHTMSGLTNGAAYTFTVQATNAAGNGPASAPSKSVTPVDVPGPPVNVTAIANSHGQAKVSFSPPEADGGSPVTGYTVTSNPPGGIDLNARTTATTHIIVGLTTGTAYTFTVQAENAAGTGPASSPSPSMLSVQPDKSKRQHLKEE